MDEGSDVEGQLEQSPYLAPVHVSCETTDPPSSQVRPFTPQVLNASS